MLDFNEQERFVMHYPTYSILLDRALELLIVTLQTPSFCFHAVVKLYNLHKRDHVELHFSVITIGNQSFNTMASVFGKLTFL